MTATGKAKLLSLLFEDKGREHVNLKFFPGENVTSENDLCEAAHELITRARKGEGKGVVPGLAGKQNHVGELVSSS